MTRFGVIIFAAGAWIGIASALAGEPASPSNVTAPCQSCHGVTGDSTSPAVPRLNGQQANYIESRLKSFFDPTRQTPAAAHAMWDISTHIGDALIPEIAEYYSSQVPTPAHGGGSLAAEGQKIYMRGVGEKIPACASCHGDMGDGRNDVPRIAGQHADYLRSQLNAFKTTMRYHAGMDINARNLTQEQIDALVAYLANG